MASIFLTTRTISTVNHDARKERHHKLFGKTKSKVARWKQFRGRMSRHAQNARTRFCDPLQGHSPAQRLFSRVVVLSLVLFMINSTTPTFAYDMGGAYNSEVYDNLAIDSEVAFYSDQDGYLTKAMPSDGEARYLNRGSEFVTHEIQPGDTLSVIAYRYDLSMNTILWQNPKLGSGNTLRIGEEITIPPADGYQVKADETLSELIDEYGGDLDATIAMNDLPEDGTLVDGQDVFLVGGEKPVVYVATTTVRDTTYTADYANTTRINTAAITATPNASGWIRPTAGTLTQGYRWGHYAYDIADRSMPPIVAVDSGTVTRADYGWNGGYGNVVEIDHGNGYKTLYAHQNELYVVAGDHVEQGDVIGQMGATGRVYGVTGIHLHFELIYNGTKINPAPVFGW